MDSLENLRRLIREADAQIMEIVCEKEKADARQPPAHIGDILINTRTGQQHVINGRVAGSLTIHEGKPEPTYFQDAKGRWGYTL